MEAEHSGLSENTGQNTEDLQEREGFQRQEFCSGECYSSHASNSHTLSLSDTDLFVLHLTEQSWAESWQSSVFLSLPFPEDGACRAETRDDAWMLPKLSFSLEAKRFSWGWASCSWERDTGLEGKRLQIFSLLTYSHHYENKGLSCKAVTRKKGSKWPLNEMQIISLQVGKMCSYISINLLSSKLPTTGGGV